MTVHCGDCLDVMPTLEPASVDAIVTDPPYGLSFMGRIWDHGIPGIPFWTEALRVAKPGMHLLAFGGTRTHHRLTCAIEDAGWEIRDCLSWLYGSGFPKSRNGPWGGTALKPAWEPIILARKPLDGTVAANVQRHGTGALNVDGCRIATWDDLNGGAYAGGVRPRSAMGLAGEAGGRSSILEGGTPRLDPSQYQQPSGRWPANVVLDEDAAALLDQQSGKLESGLLRAGQHRYGGGGYKGGFPSRVTAHDTYADCGGASRFFYCAKASRAEREAGTTGPMLRKGQHDGERTEQDIGFNKAKIVRNRHPTVKPVALMRWLCRLVTPPGGLILDPFCGSGSTGIAAVLEGFRFLGIEREAEYVTIARARIAHAAEQPNLFAMP